MYKWFYMMLLVWLFLNNSQTIKAQDEDVLFQMRSHRVISVCGDKNDRRIQVSLSIGEVKPVDSLYSFDIVLQYDTSKIRFTTGLYVNTLSEYFEYKGANVDGPGYIRLYAANMLNPQVYGNKPLIAFEGEYLGECPDSLLLNLAFAEIEVSENLINRLNYRNDSLYIPVTTKENENSFVATRFLADTIKDFNSDSIAFVNVNLNTNSLNNVNNFDLEIEYLKNDFISFDMIKAINENIVELGEIINVSDVDTSRFVINTTIDNFINDENFVELNFKKIGNEDYSLKVNLTLKNMNDCSCATSFKGDNLLIITKKDTTIDVINDEFENNFTYINGYYNNKNDEFVINSDLMMKKIMLFDIEGRQLKILDDIFSENKSFEVGNLYYGVYLVKVLLNNGFEKNIVLIKN